MPDYSNRKGAYLGKPCKHGHNHFNGQVYRTRVGCLECADSRIKKWTASSAGKVSHKTSKLRNACNVREYNKRYRKCHRQKIQDYNKHYRELNRDWYLLYYRRYNGNRRAQILKATPTWADKELINDVYRQASEMSHVFGITFDVEHIVPLISKTVCGLHVPANLTVLESSANRSKGNRWWPDEIDYTQCTDVVSNYLKTKREVLCV